jgi:hypothetical protein
MFIDQGQTLLVCYDHGKYGLEEIGRPAENFATARDVAAAYHDGEEVRFLCRTHDELSIADITEDVAAGYLEQFPGHIPEEHDSLPPYVKNSAAWASFCEAFDQDEEDGFHDAPIYPGTINHAQTGVSRGGRL